MASTSSPIRPCFFWLAFVTYVAFAAQVKECDMGRELSCSRRCYPSCSNTTTCPQADNCRSKTCQCPDDKVESANGKCIDLSYCPASHIREKRQRGPISQIPGIISQFNCLIRGNCPTTTRRPTTTTPRPAACGRNQRRYVCGTACEPTCANPNPPCTRQCVPNVCQCDTGYIRYTGACIPKYACPTTRPVVIVVPPPVYPVYPGRTLTYWIPPYQPYYGQQFRYFTCSSYEYYVQCVPCEPVCNSRYYLCYSYCVDGCTCRQGLVRDMTTNRCVYSYYCPRLYYGSGR